MIAQKEILQALHKAGLLPDSLMERLEDVISGKIALPGHIGSSTMRSQLQSMLRSAVVDHLVSEEVNGNATPEAVHKARMLANALEQKQVQQVMQKALSKVANQASELIDSLKVQLNRFCSLFLLGAW